MTPQTVIRLSLQRVLGAVRFYNCRVVQLCLEIGAVLCNIFIAQLLLLDLSASVKPSAFAFFASALMRAIFCFSIVLPPSIPNFFIFLLY